MRVAERNGLQVERAVDRVESDSNNSSRNKRRGNRCRCGLRRHAEAAAAGVQKAMKWFERGSQLESEKPARD